MFAGRNDGSILPLDHTLEQSQSLANIDRLGNGDVSHEQCHEIMLDTNLAVQSQYISFPRRPEIHHIQRPRDTIRGPKVRRASQRP